MVDGQHAVWTVAGDDSKGAAYGLVRAPMDDVLYLPFIALKRCRKATQAFSCRIIHADVQNLGGGESTLGHGVTTHPHDA